MSGPSDVVAAAYQAALAREAGGDRAGALADLEALAAAHPGVAELWNTVGTMRMSLGRTRDAEVAFEAALTREPGHAAARRNLAAALLWRGDSARALPLLAAAFKDAPSDAGLQVQLGHALVLVGNLDTAERLFRRALRFAPDAAGARAGLAALQERRGDPAGARDLLAPLVAAGDVQPNVLATWAIASGRTGYAAEAAARVEAALAAHPPAPAAAHLGHVLGDLYGRMERWEESFDAHDRANRADAAGHDPVAARARVDRILAAPPGGAVADPLPGPRLVFVLGMPRSGSSLVEQLLGAHPAVAARGERGELPALLGQLVDEQVPGGVWTDLSLDAAALTGMARWYRERVCADVGDAAVVVDKMPLNWPFVGLLPRLFPGCRVVWTVRDPLDTAVSCFSANFTQGYAFTQRLDWLGWTLADVARMQTRYAGDPGVRVQRYEALVDDLEGQARGLLAHVGLDWDSAVLRFHESERMVNTASYAQVKRRIYRSSVGRSARVRSRLGPLVDALEGRTVPR